VNQVAEENTAKFKLPAEQNQNLDDFGLANEIGKEHTQDEWLELLKQKFTEHKRQLGEGNTKSNDPNINAIAAMDINTPMNTSIPLPVPLRGKFNIMHALKNSIEEQAKLHPNTQAANEQQDRQNKQQAANFENTKRKRDLRNQMQALQGEQKAWEEKLEAQQAEDPYNLGQYRIKGKPVFGMKNRDIVISNNALLEAIVKLLFGKSFEHHCPDAVEKIKQIDEEIAKLKQELENLTAPQRNAATFEPMTGNEQASAEVQPLSEEQRQQKMQLGQQIEELQNKKKTIYDEALRKKPEAKREVVQKGVPDLLRKDIQNSKAENALGIEGADAGEALKVSSKKT